MENKTMATNKTENTGTQQTDNTTDDTKTISLRRPIMVDGVETRTLTMHPISVGDQIDAKANGGDNNALVECDLIARACHIPPETVRQVDARDYGKLQDALMGFMGVDPKALAGPTSFS